MSVAEVDMDAPRDLLVPKQLSRERRALHHDGRRPLSEAIEEPRR